MVCFEETLSLLNDSLDIGAGFENAFAVVPLLIRVSA
jgi:hypothetical protein